MKLTIKHLITMLMILVVCSLAADYYEDVEDIYGNDLLYALRDLISTNTYSSYDGAKVFLFQELDNDNGTVTCVYTGEEYHIDSSYSGQSSPNTEHTYAQSWFEPATSVKKADLHHLFITTMQVNSSRGNLPFGNVASTAASTVYYSYTPLQSYRGYDNWQHMVFQVNPQYRGNTARAILYFYTRYGDSLVQDGVNMLDTMIDWHYEDPPDAAEQSRNDMLHGFQSNRNPFVDHPEFVNRIWNPGAPNDDDLATTVPALRIDKVYPNPFREQVRIALDAKTGDRVSAAIYNLRGERIYTTTLSEGIREFAWDGCDGSGRQMPAGLYFIRLSTSTDTVSGKLLLIK
jgi:endonuclease I